MRSWVWLSGLAAAWLVACAPDGGGPGTGRDAGGGSDVDAGGGGETCAADAECGAGRRCSSVGRCIGEDECLADADCSGSLRCGEGSRSCLPEGSCMAEGDCPEGMTCDVASGTCTIGGGCGGSEFDLERLAPNMMILLDRSGSMDNEIGGRARWAIAKESIESVTTSFDTEIRFGLATYSACLPGGCSAGSIVVPIADTNAMAIDDFLGPLRGRGSSDGSPPDYLCDSGDPETSTGRSLLALVGEPSLQAPDRANAVLLVTDGAESGDCTSGGSENGPAGAAALLAQDPPVRTYVIGFGGDTPGDALDDVASAGGTGSHHPASDGAGLSRALDSIAGEVARCDFRLDSAPPDTTMLYVYFEDDPAGVPQDPMDGWTYDESTMTLSFHGAACDAIQSGEVSDIDVVYGCEGPVLE